ncbi:MAG: ATP phosphoribosyltransferase [bacterium]|nr:ATP phosphoribosyltransferase [bacterium]
MKTKLRIAIQNKGRLMNSSLKFLKSLGLDFDESCNGLIIPCKNQQVEIILARCSDIPTYVQNSIADFGIVGENLLYEQNCRLAILEKLEFGECALVIAIPKNSNFDKVTDLCGERIATSYPRSLKKYLKKNSINASIIRVKGAVEASPSLNLADAICDITQSGRTLRENGLMAIDQVLRSEAVLIGKSKDLWTELKKSL